MGSRIKDSPETTFEVYMEVGHSGTVGTEPEVRRVFPDDYAEQETLQTVPKFCFPFSVDSLAVGQVGQNFTFVLTDIDSKQRFGFCRLSSGVQSCYCILSYLPWFEVFYKLLNVLADYTIKGQESQWRELLESLYALPIPEPGVPVHLSVHAFFSVPDLRELPSIPENRNLTEYFVAVDVNNMLHLYASLLYERRVLISSSKLSTLTACVHGAAAMLYPMYWQHVYIPVLPQHLIDYCCAPMPYLIGVHSSLMEKVRGMALDDAVILNVDTNTLETPFDDLQSLPNDVVSSLKNRLKKVSTTTGDGVARAFLKAQASLFGSYRSALRIEPEEPITFSEDAFITHRSSTMRQFLQNAIQLQLFKQFIDGRLELLNSGEGFSDVFEEEINMGEYAGSDKVYHQWLLTVKKGGGAIFNTVKTKANPAMKTVYKFAKDHAKMGIKEVKSRLKQKELTENGYSGSRDEAGSAHIPSTHSKDSLTWEQRRPITVHFGQARPPRPLVAKRPRSNVGLEGSPEQPQPYRSLKEAELVEEGEEVRAERFQGSTAPPSPIQDKFSELNLLENFFSTQQGEPSHASRTKLYTHVPLGPARSLEELSSVSETQEQRANFNYQVTKHRMELSGDERTRTLPGLKHSSYNKLRSQKGPDDVTVSGRESPCWERPLSVPPLEPPEPRPPSSEIPALTQESTERPETGSITIPRPQGRKTPEPGTVLAPAITLLQGLRQGDKEVGLSVSAGGQEFRQALNMSPLSQPHPASVDSEPDLLSLLDPLSGAEEPRPPPKPPVPPRPALPTFPPPLSLNPFTQHPPYTLQRHYSPVAPSNPFSSTYVPPQTGTYFNSQPPRPLSVFSQPSVLGGTQASGAWPAAKIPPTSSSSSSLSTLLDSPAPPSLSQALPPSKPVDAPHDPFCDLLTMATMPTAVSTPPKKRVEDLRRRWETFD
ncbi:DENN domain-containing protein 1A isoform X3 [Pygocentrus nattereri]|uniref:DENN domain-containing protein 1A isoform X3 n=1 Tax=Pygocentrus nattereri TaxID=42514 RepID=UPI0018913630|nr:DENN domain-containing protein 1A isoform X3 [Pygocentrus nattereri]